MSTHGFGKQLVALGCGPKTVALAVKRHVLRQMGFSLPRLIVIEKQEVGAHWKGDDGFTDGRQLLGTSPEKDLGFPYQTDLGSPEFNEKVAAAMLGFSWSSFLIQTGRMAQWVDQGQKAPPHSLWQAYLSWAFSRVKESVDFRLGTVTSLSLRGSFWQVKYESDEGTSQIRADGVFLSGVGDSHLEGRECSSRVHTDRSYWSRQNREQLKEQLKGSMSRVAVIGAGESAGTVVADLLSRYPGVHVDWICEAGLVHSRGESPFENRMYTDPENSGWHELSLAQKREFIERTDRGVVSPAVLAQISSFGRVNVVRGRAGCIRTGAENVTISLETNGGKRELVTESVVVASGRNLKRFVWRLFDEQTKHQFLNSCKEDSYPPFEHMIGRDLSVSGLEAKLYLPGLASLNQGPGFANLSCLGSLSDRVCLPEVLHRSETKSLVTRKFASRHKAGSRASHLRQVPLSHSNAGV